MHILCPSCSAAYEVADSLVTPGRIVRCARCNEEWVAVRVEAPITDEPEDDDLAELLPQHEIETPRLTAMDRLAQPGLTRSSRGGTLRAAWAASIVLLLGLLWGAYAWRGVIMAGWPASTRLYSALGLTTQPH